MEFFGVEFTRPAGSASKTPFWRTREVLERRAGGGCSQAKVLGPICSHSPTSAIMLLKVNILS